MRVRLLVARGNDDVGAVIDVAEHQARGLIEHQLAEEVGESEKGEADKSGDAEKSDDEDGDDEDDEGDPPEAAALDPGDEKAVHPPARKRGPMKRRGRR